MAKKMKLTKEERLAIKVSRDAERQAKKDAKKDAKAIDEKKSKQYKWATRKLNQIVNRSIKSIDAGESMSQVNASIVKVVDRMRQKNVPNDSIRMMVNMIDVRLSILNDLSDALSARDMTNDVAKFEEA